MGSVQQFSVSLCESNQGQSRFEEAVETLVCLRMNDDEFVDAVILNGLRWRHPEAAGGIDILLQGKTG